MSNTETCEFTCIIITIVGSVPQSSALGQVLSELMEVIQPAVLAIPGFVGAHPPVTITVSSVGQLTERPFEHLKKDQDADAR